MDWLTSPQAWMALTTLTVMEIILGIDNIVFISVLVSRLPAELRRRARIIGLSFAMAGRIGLLFLITWIMKLQATLFSVFKLDISGRDLILIFGGLFLLAKATLEIHHALEGAHPDARQPKAATFFGVLAQVALIDLVFSLDSVITAVGMAERPIVMVIAIVVAVLVMMVSAGAISRIVEEHPTIKMLALSFLVLIGTVLIAEGLDVHVPKGYIYFAMAFSVAVEMLNLRIRGRARPVELYRHLEPAPPVLEESRNDR